ncbi:MAG: TetR family transcriptional regulator [Acidobacteria bacterium]|nr:TetR family transcriptional regulator [Acidobacteriota bacterium]
MKRNTREDVVRAAGRLFAEYGYHGTSMRDLGRELGLLGSSLYTHVESKQQLLVEVVERGAAFFQASADAAGSMEGTAADRLHSLIAGHVDVVLDHRDEVRTYLYEATALDDDARQRVLDARNQYEAVFTSVIKAGVADGSLRPDLDVRVATIFTLSILNAIDRWYSESGRMSRKKLVDEIWTFILKGLYPIS